MSPRPPDLSTRQPLGLVLLVLLALACWPGSAAAYPWVVRHGYTSCAECHSDPSGGGVLSSYGRAQAELWLGSDYGNRAEDWEPSGSQEFLFGAVPLPAGLALQLDNRSLAVPRPGDFSWIQMQTDLRAHVDLGKARAYLEAGFANEGAAGARVTSNPSANLVSRAYWVGYAPTRGLLIRAGRLNLPFGLRSEDHILAVRSQTRSSINADQQHGVAAAWSQGRWRAEVMGIAGNYQVSPDAFRERGAAAFAARRLGSRSELGVSALYAHAGNDLYDLQADATRQAYGLFGRTAPLRPLVLMGEADVLLESRGGAGGSPGFAGYLQADLEPLQGLHVVSTGEYCDDDLGDSVNGVPTAWLGARWFVHSRVDLRVDGLRGALGCSSGASPAWMGLAQLHFFL